MRPLKRPLELPSQSYPSRISQGVHRAIPSVEEWHAEANPTFGKGTKRQRTHESRLNRTFSAHQKLCTREEHDGGSFHSSQTSGTQESIHQVLDSQKSPEKKRTSWSSHLSNALFNDYADLNPYGTPTSLAFVGPQESIPSSEVDLSAIPDSPLGRETTSARGAFVRAMQLDRESTKSESPELRASVHEISPGDPTDASGEQPVTSVDLLERSSISRPVSISQNIDKCTKSHGLGVKQIGEAAADVSQTLKHRPSTVDLAQAQSVQSQRSTLRESDPIFDPIESDTESFHEKQQMQSAKRLRSSRTPTARFNSLRASNNVEVHRRDGHFLVPSVPSTIGARKSLGEVTSPGQRDNIHLLKGDPMDANKSDRNDLKRQGEPETETLEDAQSEFCGNDQFKIARQMPKCNDFVDTTQTPSQATTAWSHDSNNSANGTAELLVQQRDNRVSYQNQQPDKTKHSGQDVNAGLSSIDSSRLAQEAEQLVESEVQQAKEEVRGGKAEEKKSFREARGRGTAAKKEIAERKTKEDVLANKEGAKGSTARADESAQTKKATAKEENLAEAKRMEETRVNEALLSEDKRISERLAPHQRIKETLLAEKATKLMLAADGAKQIEAERKEKVKARHEELALQKQANDAKANEQAREAQGRDCDKKAREEQHAREHAQQLAAIEPKDAKDKAPQARTAQETATAVKEQAQKRLVVQSAQKLRDASESQSRASTNPSTSLNSAGPKRSMTPHIPESSITKSSPHLSSLRSTPLSSRSPGNMDAPLRSALRHTPGALRRSVSSVSFDVPPPAKLNEDIPSTPIPKPLKVINKELATKSSSATDLPIDPPKPISSPPSKTSIKTLNLKKASGSTITKTLAKNGKVQTKLNVTREAKKLKGRVGAPPIKSVQASKQEIILSSGEDSSTSEDPMWQTGNAEAGPSSRKPTLPVALEKMPTAEVKPSAACIDPSIRNIEIEKDTKAAPAALPRSTSTSDTASLKKSISRSPALALSETISLSSDSASSSESELESDSEKEPQAPSSKTPTGTKTGTRVPLPIKKVSKAVNTEIKQPEGHTKSKASSQTSSQALLSRSRSTILKRVDSEHVDKAADKQLQLESRQSVPSPRFDQASSITNSAVDDKTINQGLDHAGRLPNGMRPANYKYPSLSELQKLPRAVTPKAEPKVDTFSSQPVGALPVGMSGSDSSSSDSDDSSSNSDEDEDVDRPPSQARTRKTFPGLKGALKRRSSRMG